MLLALKISNIAVIEEAEMHFGPGLTVLTGETGAGKSILIDALGLLMGGRAETELIRNGCGEASVEAVWAKTPLLAARLAELGLPDLGDEISLRRVLAPSSRGKVYVNGALVTVGVLGRLMRGAIDVSGQHDYISLFDPSLHRALLDRAGKLGLLLEEYQKEFRCLREIDQRLAELGGTEEQVQQRIEFLRFQLDEIARVNPAPAEDEKLEEERRRLMAAEKLRRAAGQAEDLLAGQDGAALELLGRALATLTEAAKIDRTLDAFAASLKVSLSELEENARGLSRYARTLESDPKRLADTEERLDSIRRLCRKHGCGLDGLLARRSDLTNELDALQNRQTLLDALSEDRARVEAAARSRALSLSATREQAAGHLSTAVRDGLAQLAMPKSQFRVEVRPGLELGRDGLDEVEFLFSANEGEPLRALSRVASGGEGSRVLLALKRALTAVDECSCYVLDESDGGVGGAVAEVVGRMVKEIGMNRQVLFITHLPQVAAYADSHLVIEKRLRSGRTVSRVLQLSTPEARTRELARMLSGVQITNEARSAAEALMRSATRPSASGSRRCPRPAPDVHSQL
jgi:DNA repair protein RecN (Recombination protein N)